jgi:peptidoglycan/LPS O-acetylase OafA/YrhL
MIILFFFSVYVVHKYTFSTLFPSLLASLTYTHNFFYGREVMPLVNMVAWSLEVEVQFYILAPLMAMVFMLKKEQRRGILLVAAFVSVAIQGYHLLPFRSLLDYLHFFLAGFLMADFKVSGKRIPLNKMTGVLSIAALILLNAYWYDDTSIFLNTGLFISLSVLVYMCILGGFMKHLLSAKFTTTIGGMCYSVYLVHAAVLSVVLNIYLRKIVFHTYYPDLILYSIISVILVGIVSSVYYVLVERPCMQKGWYKTFIPARLVNRF